MKKFDKFSIDDDIIYLTTLESQRSYLNNKKQNSTPCETYFLFDQFFFYFEIFV